VDLLGILPLILLAVAFYLLLMRPAKNRQKQQAALIASVGPGTQIMTTAGMYGTVVARDGDDVTVSIAPGVEVQMLAAAIGKVVEPALPAMPPASPGTAGSASDGPSVSE
jgi:preprotein translocase subunit YajC